MTQTQYYTDKVDVDSSAFDTLWYDAPSRRAFARFNSGTTVGYEGVESSTFNAWANADSPGNFWRQYIKKQNFKGVDGNVYFTPRASEPKVQTVNAGASIYGDNTPTPNDYTSAVNAIQAATKSFDVTPELAKNDVNAPSVYRVVLEVRADSLVQAATLFANEDDVEVSSVTRL